MDKMKLKDLKRDELIALSNIIGEYIHKNEEVLKSMDIDDIKDKIMLFQAHGFFLKLRKKIIEIMNPQKSITVSMSMSEAMSVFYICNHVETTDYPDVVRILVVGQLQGKFA